MYRRSLRELYRIVEITISFFSVYHQFPNFWPIIEPWPFRYRITVVLTVFQCRRKSLNILRAEHVWDAQLKSVRWHSCSQTFRPLIRVRFQKDHSESGWSGRWRVPLRRLGLFDARSLLVHPIVQVKFVRDERDIDPVPYRGAAHSFPAGRLASGTTIQCRT